MQIASSISKFPIVGIVASAGGLEAFTQLLSHLPIDTGMAFVLIQHLSPNRENFLITDLKCETVVESYLLFLLFKTYYQIVLEAINCFLCHLDYSSSE